MKTALLVPSKRVYRILSKWLFRTVSALLVFLAYSQAQAQSGGFLIEGVVVDERQEPLSFANIALFRSADSVLVTGAVSGTGGDFGIRTDPGRFYARISFLSYEDHIVPDIVIGSGGKDLGVIALTPAQDLLEELVVRGERSVMELYLDKRVFNVGTDLTTVSGSAAEVLANVPSVTVDLEGNVSLRGSGNVRILIDGKPSGLTGINTADALRQVQAELIESVEVITNPSARYDAEGEAGIINIILKKERRRGVNGTFSARIGYPANYLASYNLNLRRDRFNFFSSYGFSYRQGPGSGISYQKYSTPDTTFSFEQFNRRVRGGTSHNLIGGIDYYFSEKSALTASAIYRLSDGLNTSDFEFRDMGENDELLRTVYRREREEEPEHNAEVALSYRREFSDKDHTFTADFKWIENVETERAGITETDDLGSVLFQRSSNTENERNVFVQADYIAPFMKKGRFESGVRSTLRVIDNDFLVEQQDAESDWEVLPGFDNSMLYTENIYAAYTQLANESGRFSYQGGLRGELSDISIALKKSDEVDVQTYFNLFPSAHLAYKLSDSRTLQLSYSYRISRPGFRDLLPFSGYGNNRLVMTGNPELRPEYTHSIEGAHLLNWNSGSLLGSAYYRHRTGVIQRITIVDSIGFNRVFPINLATEDALGFEFNFSWSPVNWISYNANANFFRAITEGVWEGEVLQRDTYTWSGQSNLRLTLFDNWNFQANFNYMAPQETPQGRRRSMYALDLALARDFFDGKANINLSVRDLLNTRRWREVIIQDGFYSESDFQWRARQIMLNFNYRLNQGKDSGRRNGNRGGDGGGFDGGDY